jgi:glycosyltransferase involved in cell wall biosynthesis
MAILLFPGELSPRHYPMLRLLKKQNWTFTVIAWDRKGNREVSKEDVDLIDNWYWIRLSAPIWSIRLLMKLPFLYLQIWMKAWKLKKRPDIWMCEHYFMLPCLLLLPGKKVYDALEQYSLDLSFYFGSFHRFFFPFIKLIEGLMASFLDGILTIDTKSGWLEKFFRKWNSNVLVIWNLPSIASSPTEIDLEPVRAQYAGKQVVAFAGGLIREKGLFIALEACATLKHSNPNILFLFIGTLKEETTNVNLFVERKGIINNVFFLRAMPYDEMLKHLCCAHVGLALYQRCLHYPFTSSGTARKIFTYMQAGLPIIAPDFGEIGTIVEKTGCGLLIDTSKPDIVADAIQSLIRDFESAKLMGQRGQTAFRELYNWEREHQEFQMFMELVCD